MKTFKIGTCKLIEFGNKINNMEIDPICIYGSMHDIMTVTPENVDGLWHPHYIDQDPNDHLYDHHHGVGSDYWFES